MEEIWKSVKGFEDLYQVSNKGRLASVRNGSFFRILSSKNSKGGYISLVLTRGETSRSVRMHRLVYETFVSDIPRGNRYHIHHINHDKQDNRVENLTLVTAKEHYRMDIDSKDTSGLRPIWENYQGKPAAKKIIQKNLNGEVVAVYESAQEAYLATGVCPRNIRQVASKEPYNKKGSIRKQAGGFIWEDAEK